MRFIDALECSVFDRDIFRELREGKVDCVTCTLAFWEDASETMECIAHWRDLERENTDLILIGKSAADIETAHRTDRTAILLGCQNTSPLEERVRYVELFYDLGIRVMQLTYNNQNTYGGSCYEPNDSGLSRAGRELVREMNSVGMLIDLSHVGERTSFDVLELSESPVAITHSVPWAAYQHRRNKSNELLRMLASKGGVLGIAAYRQIAGSWVDSLDDWCRLIIYAVELIGIEHVGIGTDLGQKSTDADLNWMRHGRWTRNVDYGAGSASDPGNGAPVAWCESPRIFPSIAEQLSRCGFSSDEVALVMGDNFLRLYRTVFDGSDVPTLSPTASLVDSPKR